MLHPLTSPLWTPIVTWSLFVILPFSAAIYSELLCFRKLTLGMQSDLDLPGGLLPFRSRLGGLGLPPSLLLARCPAHLTSGTTGDAVSRSPSGITRERCNGLEENATRVRKEMEAGTMMQPYQT